MNDQPEAEGPREFDLEDDESGEDTAESNTIKEAAYAAIRLMTTDEYMALLDKAEGFGEFFVLASQFKPPDVAERLAALEVRRKTQARRNQAMFKRLARMMEQRERDQAAQSAGQGPETDAS